jgi:hypothetical protein
MLDFLFGPPNPTRSWPVVGEREITFDLDNASINGVRLGEPLDRARFLGPDEDRRAFRGGELLYFSKGLAVSFSLRSQALVAYRIVQSDPLEPRFQPFRGTVLSHGRPERLAALSPERFVNEYGDCYWRDRDEEHDESILFFEFVGLEWQVEFDLESRFKCITVTSEPIMAVEEQRLAYGVTELWPPKTK